MARLFIGAIRSKCTRLVSKSFAFFIRLLFPLLLADDAETFVVDLPPQGDKVFVLQIAATDIAPIENNVVDENEVAIGENVAIGNNVAIGEDVAIGDNVAIGNNINGVETLTLNRCVFDDDGCVESYYYRIY